MAEKRYAVNSQSFAKIREGDYYYIDKTDMVYNITQKYSSVFLSRPRRFGKTLLTQVLDAYFSGKKELFQGLAIEKLEHDWTQHPVLHFDLSGMKLGTAEQVRSQISHALGDLEKKYGLQASSDDLGNRMNDLIVGSQKKHGQPAVVIIDEYDAPILDAYGKESVKDIRNVLMTFFTPLKKHEESLRFVFLTGVTKFSSLSIFSSLNHLSDISLLPEYNSLCGFTDEEIDQTFPEGIVRLSERYKMPPVEMRQCMKDHYDGYRFSEKDEGVYNPFSVVNALNNAKLGQYWFGSGTPTFITKALRDSNITPEQLGDQELSQEAFDTPIEPINGRLNVKALLYQSGYFTIKGYERDIDAYLVGIPNREVREGLMKVLLPYYLDNLDINDAAVMMVKRLGRAIAQDDTDQMRDLLKDFFSTIPYSDRKLPEEHYKTILYILFSMTAQFVDAETRSSKGRMDIVLFNRRNIYILELKLDGSTEQAAKQMNLQRYAERFGMTGKPTIKIAVNFSSQEHNITGWKIVE